MNEWNVVLILQVFISVYHKLKDEWQNVCFEIGLDLTCFILFCFVLFFFSRFPILDKDWGNDVVSWYNAVVTIAKSNFVLQTLV